MPRCRHIVWIALAWIVVGLAPAWAGDAGAERAEAWKRAAAFLAAHEAKDRESQARHADSTDVDPWLVADALCADAHYEAAAADPTPALRANRLACHGVRAT